MSVELTFHLGPEALEADVLAAIERLAISVPRLSQEELIRQSLSRYNLSRAKGKPLAEAIIQDLRHDEGKRPAWIEHCCIDLLRSRISLIHQELVELATKTTSRLIKSAIINKIYSGIAAGYPQLADAAAEACTRKQLALPPEPEREESPPSVGKGIQVDFGPDEEDPQSNVSSPAETSGQDTSERPLAESVETEVRQVTDLALACLVEVKERLQPAASELSISMDTPTVHAWAMACFLAVSRAQTLK